MGYYTQYSMAVSRDFSEQEAAIVKECFDKFLGSVYASKFFDKHLAESEYNGRYDIADCLNDSYLCEELKWYDWETDMKELSTKIPDVLFVLEGEGETNEDMWKAYFKNGKFFHARAEIIYPVPPKDIFD